MPKTNYQKFFLNTFLLFTFCLISSTTVSASVINEMVDGMSGFSIVGDPDGKIWLDPTNTNIFGKTYSEMVTWASTNGWRFATGDEFNDLANALMPAGRPYSSPTYSDSELNHFNLNEANIMGAIGWSTPSPSVPYQQLIGFTGEAFTYSRGLTILYEDDGLGNFYHSYDTAMGWGDPDSIVYYGDESAWLIKESQVVIPEPTTMLLFGFGLLGLAGIGRRKK